MIKYHRRFNLYAKDNKSNPSNSPYDLAVVAADTIYQNIYICDESYFTLKYAITLHQ